ncbi:Uncharacterized protein APZ42_006336, partial [Daphnia magna]
KPEMQSETVVLTFIATIPDRVTLASMSFRVQMSIPNPYRCHKCGKLGHTTARCNANLESCKKCSKPHPQNQDCSTHCINCNNDSHESSDNECPSYREMKKIIKMAYLEGIPIEEARARQVNRTYGPARKPMAVSPTQDSLNSSQYLEMAAVKEQLKALQEEIKVMREKTFPRINGKIN